MVIPIPAGLAPPLAGPPPPELRDKFQVIKICTLTLFFCAIGRIFAGFMLVTPEHTGMHWHGSSAFGPAPSLFINALIGVFLQNDDPTFRPIYECLTNSLLKPCHEQGMCQGGLTCLMPFSIFNAVSIVFDVLLPPYTWLLIPDYLAKATSGTSMASLGSALTVAAVIGAFLAEAVAAFYGFKCIQQARQGGITQQGGDWGQEMARPPTSGGPSNWGGGPLGGGPGGPLGGADRFQGRYAGLNYGNVDEETAAPERAQVGGTGQNFQVFQGSGQRLGGD